MYCLVDRRITPAARHQDYAAKLAWHQLAGHCDAPFISSLNREAALAAPYWCAHNGRPPASPAISQFDGTVDVITILRHISSRLAGR
jgi:hypothetical protein